jgi:hypothetical protein
MGANAIKLEYFTKVLRERQEEEERGGKKANRL